MKGNKRVCNVAKLATPTTGQATGQTENTRFVNKISAVKMNLR